MPKKRKCLRCGCTDAKACEGGCSWVGDTDICTKCLTETERSLYLSLSINREDRKGALALDKVSLERAEKMKREFEHLVTDRSTMADCIGMLRGVVLEVTPQIGKVVLQDYKRLNLGLMLAKKLIGEVRP